jgi:predicted MFS family arabinose efflux permease
VDRRLALLAFGSFVVATDGTLIVGLLRRVAADLSASPAAIGQSIAVFAFAYAAGAPLLIVRTRGWRQERVLLSALILFAAANLATALAGSLATLLAARVVAGAAAGAFTPTAAALAAVSVERRGRALAFVVGGASAAAIVGVPLGTIVGRLSGLACRVLSRGGDELGAYRRVTERPQGIGAVATTRFLASSATAPSSDDTARHAALGDRQFHLLHLPRRRLA